MYVYLHRIATARIHVHYDKRTWDNGKGFTHSLTHLLTHVPLCITTSRLSPSHTMLIRFTVAGFSKLPQMHMITTHSEYIENRSTSQPREVNTVIFVLCLAYLKLALLPVPSHIYRGSHWYSTAPSHSKATGHAASASLHLQGSVPPFRHSSPIHGSSLGASAAGATRHGQIRSPAFQ